MKIDRLPLFFYIFLSLLNFPIAAHQGPKIIEYHLAWPTGIGGTHDIVFNPKGPKVLWVSGPNHDAIAKVRLNGKAKFYEMPVGSFPHGMAFDYKGRLWLALEGIGFVARISEHGKIEEMIDVQYASQNSAPHGMGSSCGGKFIWFTGKASNTVGKINVKTGEVTQYLLPTPNSQPIYISEGPDGKMWCTELTGNNIARISQNGKIREFPIPTPNSRPIAIVPSPEKDAMWFTEETSHIVARISLHGKIVEYKVPETANNQFLAALTFDDQNNLWTQSYPNPAFPEAPAHDYIIRISKRILKAHEGNISSIPFTYYRVPTTSAILHRIIQAQDGNMWFTELAADSLGKLILKNECKHFTWSLK